MAHLFIIENLLIVGCYQSEVFIEVLSFDYK